MTSSAFYGQPDGGRTPPLVRHRKFVQTTVNKRDESLQYLLRGTAITIITLRLRTCWSRDQWRTGGASPGRCNNLLSHVSWGPVFFFFGSEDSQASHLARPQ